MSKEDRAIVVGIQTYPELGNLEGPENDAREFVKWLEDAEGGAVPHNQVVQILSSEWPGPFDPPSLAEPTTFRIQNAFEDLQKQAKEQSKAGKGRRLGRRLYLYFAGHGFTPKAEHTALLTANASHLNTSYHILGPYMADWFYRAGLFDEVVLFMDCCREQYPAPMLNMPYAAQTDPTAEGRVKWFHAFGTVQGQAARERPMEDGTVRGIFTTALLTGLRGAAANGAGQVTAGGLSAYLYNHMKTFLRPEDVDDPRVPKEPAVIFPPRFSDSLVLATIPRGVLNRLLGREVRARSRVRVHLPADALGKPAKILGDKFAVVQTASPQASPWEVELEVGTYMAQSEGLNDSPVFEVSGTGDVDVRFS